ncbi:MAG: hypothetical protein Q9184_003418 [Pyrenodesmia sp. 2 TL-2023]
MDPVVDNFFTGALQGANETSWLRTTFEAQLPGLADLVESRIEDVCLMTDVVGDFILHALEILGRFATDAIYGEEIIRYTRERLHKLEEQSDLSDLAVGDYLDDKHAALKFIAIEIDAALRNCG